MRSLAIIALLLLTSWPVPGQEVIIARRRVVASAGVALVVAPNVVNAGSSNTGTQSIACAVGDTLLLAVQIFSTTETPTLTTATGNTLTPVSGATNAHGTINMSVSLWVVNNCNGTTGNYTYGSATANFPNIFTSEWSGTNTSAPIDQANVCFNAPAVNNSLACSITVTTATGGAWNIFSSSDNTGTWPTVASWTRQALTPAPGSYTKLGASIGALTFPSTNYVSAMPECVGLIVGLK